MKKHQLLAYIVLLVTVLSYLVINREIAFTYGLLASLVNIGIAIGVYQHQSKQVPSYPNQALVIVISTTLIRFLVTGALLVYGFKWLGFTPKPLLLGFVLGQIFFLIHHLLVAKNNGK